MDEAVSPRGLPREVSSTSDVDEELRAELLRRADLDQQVRPGPGEPWPDDQLQRAREVDADNTAWLNGLVRGQGWPGVSVAGRDGAHAAWLLAQHADASPEVQRTFLDALRAAADHGEAAAADLAYLEDRVRVNAGRPQLYGTQYRFTETGCEPQPIEDLSRVDERRANAGLGPLAEYDALIRSANGRG
jgi:Family of unknown function (DUF6624)